jgi:hypothetical protein
MKIKTVAEVLEILGGQAAAQARDLRGHAKQPHELEAAKNWGTIGRILEKARGEIDALAKRTE